MKHRLDGPIVGYSLLGVAALIVSAPATYNLVSLYHSDGSTIGVVATVALLVILEAGAVAAKLATLWATEGKRWLLGFTFAALGVNTLSNLIHGGAVASANGLPWLAAWGGALLYAAFLPVLIYMAMHLICVRVARLRGMERSVSEEVSSILLPVAHAVEVARQAQRSLASLQPAPALMEPQASYPRAEQVATPEAAHPALTPSDECHGCGTKATKMQLRTAAQHNGWVCKGCGVRVSAR